MLQGLVIRLQRLGWAVRTKIGAAFGLVLVCFIVNGLISVWLLFGIRDSLQEQKANAVQLERLQRYELAYKSQQGIYSDAIFVTSVKFIRDNFKSIITNELIKRDRFDPDLANRRFEDKFDDYYTDALRHFLELTNFIMLGQLDEANLKWQEFRPDFDKVTTLLAERHNQLAQKRATEEAEVSSFIFLATTLIATLAVLSILLALFLLWLIGRVLVRPLNELQLGLNQMAQGNLDQRLAIQNQDEVGKLAQSFTQALNSLQQVLRGVQISESLRMVTGQLAVVSKQQSDGSAEQVSALAQVMAAMQELGQTAGQIADNAVQVAILTSDTLGQIERVAEAGSTSRQRAHQMVEVVETTLNGVERVGRRVDEFSQSMTELNGQSEAISKVVRLLGSIADEVHLLALNAAIEAAGAGQSGDRFRVVAHQIKQLAGRANQATAEAQQLVGQVQESSRIALAQIEQGQTEVKAVVRANSGLRSNLYELEQSAEQVAEAVAYLLNLAGKVSEQAEEIRQATQQQRASSEQVIFSARSAGEIAEETASMTHQIASSSSQLDNLTNQLTGVLKQVKLAT